MPIKCEKIGIIANFSSELACDAYQELTAQYNLIDILAFPQEVCDVIITVGGDGTMLKALHHVLGSKTYVFGMNRGSIGFLLNKYSSEDLIERIMNSCITILKPLEMTVQTNKGVIEKSLAINEVALLRQTNQSAKISISINNKRRLTCLVGDGVIVSTPAGSTAYNAAAHGPLLPLDSNMLALTPISPFRPRLWPGALIPKNSEIIFEILEAEKRPVSAVADSLEIRNAIKVIVKEIDIPLFLLSDPEDRLEDRLLQEQFYN